MGDFNGEETGMLENSFRYLEYLLNAPRVVHFIPDNEGVIVEKIKNSVRISQPVDHLRK